MLRWLYPRRSLPGILLLLTLIVLLPVFLLLPKYQTGPPVFLLSHPYFQYDLDIEEPRTHGQKCVLPKIHPFHPSVWDFLQPPKPIVCKSRGHSFTGVDRLAGMLRYNYTEIRLHRSTVGVPLHCTMSPVERDSSVGNGDDKILYGKEVPMPQGGAPLPTHVEAVRVMCRNFMSMPMHDYLHAYIRNVTPPVPEKEPEHPVNVLIFGLDSMSRLAFIRHLPRTYRYLTENLGMTVLRGMNKVGDNTYPNLIALLTGNKAYGGNLPDDSHGFDEWPLIWKNFSAAGYATMWAEDFPDYGLFNYLAKGFRKPPTLHYLRPFWLAIKDSPLLKVSSHMCYGSKPRHILQMEYVKDFVDTYEEKQQPYFGFSFLAELSHEYMSRVASADDHFLEFFRYLSHDAGYLNNTLFVVMSDHGHRFDPIRTTQVGHIEERMPFFAIRVPESILSVQPSIKRNLLLNRGRLVTPFDMHATLLDLLGFITAGQPLGRPKPLPGTLGMSLFSEIRANRTCSDASIPVNYCTCETEAAISKKDSRALSAAAATLDRVNELLSNGGPDIAGRCAVLTLGVIRTAHLVRTVEDFNVDSEGKVRVVLEVEPSKAIFEATVLILGTEVAVLGDVSRINPYGNQSICIKHVILRKYCFCHQGGKKVTVKL